MSYPHVITELPERIRSKVKPQIGGCWHWTAAKNCGGYGNIYWEGQQRGAHRVVYRILVGEIEADLQVDHLCRNRTCVNPEHMEIVTRQENHRRGIQRQVAIEMGAQMTHCKRGHPFNEENTIRRAGGNGKRACRECARLKQRERHRKKVGIPLDAPVLGQETHCRKCGQEWTEENTYRAPGNPSKRMCRACLRERRKARTQREKETQECLAA